MADWMFHLQSGVRVQTPVGAREVCTRSLFSVYCVAIDACHNVEAGLPARVEATALWLTAGGWILSNHTMSCAQNISEISFPFTTLHTLGYAWIVLKIVRWGNSLSYGPSRAPKNGSTRVAYVRCCRCVDPKLVWKLLELFVYNLKRSVHHQSRQTIIFWQGKPMLARVHFFSKAFRVKLSKLGFGPFHESKIEIDIHVYFKVK